MVPSFDEFTRRRLERKQGVLDALKRAVRLMFDPVAAAVSDEYRKNPTSENKDRILRSVPADRREEMAAKIDAIDRELAR